MSVPSKCAASGDLEAPEPQKRRVYDEAEDDESVPESERSDDDSYRSQPWATDSDCDDMDSTDALGERLRIKLLEMEAERIVAAAIPPATGGDARYAEVASAGRPTIEERVKDYRLLEEVDGALSWIDYRGPGGRTPEMRANAVWTLRKLEEAGIDYVARWAQGEDGIQYIEMIFHGPHILHPGCVPASIFKAEACFNALDGEEPVVTTYEAEAVFGGLRCSLLTSIGRDEYLGKADWITQSAARHIVREAVMTVDDLRDPRQRGKPVWAGCGRRDGTPGTFGIGDSAHKGCPILDITEPLVPKGDRDPKNWCLPDFKEW